MPNHIHGIIEITEHPHNYARVNDPGYVRANNHSPLPNGTTKTIGSIVRGFKIGVTKLYRKNLYSNQNTKLWQRNYYDHIIRDEKSYNQIVEYINENPVNWHIDRLNQEDL